MATDQRYRERAEEAREKAETASDEPAGGHGWRSPKVLSGSQSNPSESRCGVWSG